MIFLTVGTQLPFDRLAKSVDGWCLNTGRSDVFGQIADPGSNGYHPQHFEWQKFVEPDEFLTRFEQADFVIAHAGMGSIITALTMARKIVIMPRKAHLQEQRNDHQLATAARFSERPGIYVANDETEMSTILDRLSDDNQPEHTNTISQFADESLLNAIREFIHEPVRNGRG